MVECTRSNSERMATNVIWLHVLHSLFNEPINRVEVGKEQKLEYSNGSYGQKE